MEYLAEHAQEIETLPVSNRKNDLSYYFDRLLLLLLLVLMTFSRSHRLNRYLVAHHTIVPLPIPYPHIEPS